MARKQASGNYNKRFALKKPVEGTPSATGERTTTWSEVASFWGSLWPVRGREYYEAQQIQSEVTHVIRCWYRSDVEFSTERALWLGTRRFDILSAIDIDEAHRELELRVVEQL